MSAVVNRERLVVFKCVFAEVKGQIVHMQKMEMVLDEPPATMIRIKGRLIEGGWMDVFLAVKYKQAGR